MKLTALLLIISMLNVTAAGKAQSIYFSGKQVSLEKVFAEIKTQTGYRVLYTNNTLLGTVPVTVNARGTSLLVFLDEVLKNQPVKFSIESKTIIISRKTPVISLPDQSSSLEVIIDRLQLKGLVADKDGKPLAGATVTAKGTKLATVTNAEGRFTLNVNTGTIIVVSFIGYESKEMKITSALLNQEGGLIITLSPVIESLDQVSVVSTGYQTIAKERATGSFSQIRQEELERKITVSVVDKLEGMASGLLISGNVPDAGGRPAKSNYLSVRGRNTLNAQQDPLIVVDGFPFESDLALLNPEDIARITFLKDAAAASIWGVRAANGVIVIETKKGKQHQRSISFSANYTLAEKPDLGYRPIASSADYLDFEREAVEKGLISNPFGRYRPTVSAGADLYFRHKRGQISLNERDSMLNQLAGYDFKDTYSKYLLRSQQSQQYNLSTSGGNEFASYFLSGSYSKELPMARGNKNHRITINSNNRFALNKRLSVLVGMMGIMSEATNNGPGLRPLEPGSNTLLPYDRIVDENGSPIQYARAYHGQALDSLTKLGYLPWRYDYLTEMANADNTSKYTHYRINATVQYKIFQGLSADLSGLYEKSFTRARNHNSIKTYAARNIINNYTSVKSGSNPRELVYGIPLGGILDVNNNDFEQYNLRGQLNYNKQINLNHRIDALGGAEMRQTWTAANSTRVYGYDDQTLASRPINFDQPYTLALLGTTSRIGNPNSFSDARDRYLSWFFNANYTFKNKYVLSGSSRLDDSNLFGASKAYRSTPFWSIGGLWKLGEEAFMSNAIINKLNLRLTYGVNGNVDKTTSPHLIASISPYTSFYNRLPYAYISTPANPFLRWEKTNTLNIAVDFSAWDNRLDFSLELYKKKCFDLLGAAEVNPTYGFTSVTINTARMNNEGVDLNVSGTIIQKKNIQWRTQFNFGYNTNKVISSNFQRENVVYYVNSGKGSSPIKGRPVDGIYSYRFGGLDSLGRPTVLSGENKKMLVTADINNDLNTITYSGRTVPKYFGGLTNIFRLNQFELSVFITYKLGHVYRKPGIEYSSYSTQKTINNDAGLRWKKAGDEALTNVPVMPGNSIGYNGAWYTQSDLLIRNASHIRLREVSLMYELAPGLLKKLRLQQLSLMVYARNLALWTANNDGVDPDYVPSPNYSVLPPARSFSIGLRTSF